MFHIVQWQMPTTNQKLQGIVWEICVKSMRLRKIICSVLLHFSVCEIN